MPPGVESISNMQIQPVKQTHTAAQMRCKNNRQHNSSIMADMHKKIHANGLSKLKSSAGTLKSVQILHPKMSVLKIAVKAAHTLTTRTHVLNWRIEFCSDILPPTQK